MGVVRSSNIIIILNDENNKSIIPCQVLNRHQVAQVYLSEATAMSVWHRKIVSDNVELYVYWPYLILLVVEQEWAPLVIQNI